MDSCDPSNQQHLRMKFTTMMTGGQQQQEQQHHVGAPSSSAAKRPSLQVQPESVLESNDQPLPFPSRFVFVHRFPSVSNNNNTLLERRHHYQQHAMTHTNPSAMQTMERKEENGVGNGWGSGCGVDRGRVDVVVDGVHKIPARDVLAFQVLLMLLHAKTRWNTTSGT